MLKALRVSVGHWWPWTDTELSFTKSLYGIHIGRDLLIYVESGRVFYETIALSWPVSFPRNEYNTLI